MLVRACKMIYFLYFCKNKKLSLLKSSIKLNMYKIFDKINLAFFCCVAVFFLLTVSRLEASTTQSANNPRLSRKAWVAPQLIDTNEKIKIYIARTVVGLGIDTSLFPAEKIHSAINFITMLNDDYELIADSVVTEAMQKIKQPFTAFDIAREIRADRIFIIKVEQLMNVLKAEIIVANPLKTDSAKVSEGFAPLHLFNKNTHAPLYDPALLVALQRAFAVSENDSLMFRFQNEPFDVKPAPNLVICGLEFVNNPVFSHWEIFNNPLITSYEYAELIFEAINRTKNWVVFDIDSRDAIYAMFNLFLIENHIAPSINELSALKNFGVFHFITGRVERNRDNVVFTLSLHQILETEVIGTGEVVEIKSVSGTLHKNDITEPKNIIKRLATQLIHQN